MFKVGDIVKGTVSGIEDYGIFIKLNDDYRGLIHISEIEHNYISNIKKVAKVNEEIYVYILDVDDKNKHLKLSIKNINHTFGNNKVKIQESIKGFLPLYEKLPKWIEEKQEG